MDQITNESLIRLEALLSDFVNHDIKAEQNEIIQLIAKTGLSCFIWDQLKILLCFKLQQAIESYEFPSEIIQQKIIEIQKIIQNSKSEPLSLQRFCELILSPRDFYSGPLKLINALEKLTSVWSQNQTYSQDQFLQQIQLIIQKNQLQQQQENNQITNETTNQQIISAL
eukprot:TRINITY_DN2354_c3_g1_i1.p1 TRINITY_DN2354_c3_g1~~TRINITY_DN2354_c3_g1_i1.p1  ORF type:complete len:169 (-),score=88.79 TRINITY_DN2354_c3_g1_i1:118-624(-)